MPTVNPKEVGDDIYEQYAIKKTQELDSAIAGVKGGFYVFNANGRLVVPTVVSNEITTTREGIVQAAANVPAVTLTAAQITAGGPYPTIQCHMRGSWVLASAVADLHPGNKVKLVGDGTTITSGRVQKLGSSDNIVESVGTIYEIYTRGTNGAVKNKTVLGDLVVVQTGLV